MKNRKSSNGQNDIIDQIVTERHRREMTQSELAQLVGCPQPSIARIENRAVSPTIDMINKICDVLGVELFLKKK